MNIFDLVQAKEIGTYWLGTRDSRIPYLGATLFPAKKQLGLDLSWIKGRDGLPVALTPSAFDAKATLRDRIGVEEISTEMPFFRESMRIGEKERQELLKVSDSANAAMMQPIINKIYDDAGQLIAGAEVVAERMRMQLLSTGKISIVATKDRVAYNYDYKHNSALKETLATSTDKWNDFENSRPIQDIQRWQQKVQDETGEKPTKAIMTSKTWNYLLMNKSIRLDMNPIGGQNIIMTDSMLQQYLSAKLGLKVAVYDKRYKLELGGEGYKFFPDDIVTLIPDTNLGNTYYGTTPEEADLMSGNTDAQVSIVDTGVAVTTIKEPHPVNVFTVVSSIVLPSFEKIDHVFIATVA